MEGLLAIIAAIEKMPNLTSLKCASTVEHAILPPGSVERAVWGCGTWGGTLSGGLSHFLL